MSTHMKPRKNPKTRPKKKNPCDFAICTHAHNSNNTEDTIHLLLFSTKKEDQKLIDRAMNKRTNDLYICMFVCTTRRVPQKWQ